MPRMDPILPILFVSSYWAIVLGIFGGPGKFPKPDHVWYSSLNSKMALQLDPLGRASATNSAGCLDGRRGKQRIAQQARKLRELPARRIPGASYVVPFWVVYYSP